MNTPENIEPNEIIPPYAPIPAGQSLHNIPTPKGFKKGKLSGLLIPAEEARVIITKSEKADNTKNLAKKKGAEDEPTQSRTQQELLLALINTPKYFEKRILDKHGDTPLIREVSEHIATLTKEDAHPFLEAKGPFSPEAIMRDIKIREYHNRITGETESMTISKPGALEQALIVVVDEAKDRVIQKSEIIERVPEIIQTILRTYRLNATKESYLPEMPDFSNKLILLLSTFTREQIGANAKKIRFAFYDCLSEINLPLSQKEQLAVLMSEQGDLEHPLACEVILAISHDNPEHKIIQEQNKLREELLKLLSCSPEEAFKNYDVFDAASRRLILAEDAVNPDKGKVGLEVEFVCKYPHRKIPSGWTVGTGGYKYFELRKSDTNLSWSGDYMKECEEAVRWLRDCAHDVAYTTHVHLDRKQHPRKPNLGGLFSNSMIKENDHGTWEVRANSVPMTQRGISVPSWLGLVSLYKSASNTESKTDNMATGLALDGSESYLKLIWGHICLNFQDANTRLAALFALRYPRSFRTVGTLALKTSFESSSLPAFNAILKKEEIELRDPMDYYGQADFSRDTPSLLKDPNEEVRIITIRALGEHLKDLPELVPALLTDPNEDVRHNTIKALGENVKNFYSEIYSLLVDRDEDVRRATIVSLGEHLKNFPELIPALLTDSDQNIRRNTIRALGEDVKNFSALIHPLLVDSSDFIREYAIGALGEHIKNFPELIPSLLKDPSNRVRRATIVALGEHIKNFPELIPTFLKDPDMHIRTEAIRALGEYLKNLPELIPALLGDRDEDVRRATIVALGEHIKNFPELIPTLLTDFNESIRSQAIIALGEHIKNFPELIPSLLMNSRYYAREQTIKALGENVKNLSPIIHSLLVSRDDYTRGETVMALGEHLKNFPELIPTLLTDPNEDNRQQTITALGGQIDGWVDDETIQSLKDNEHTSFCIKLGLIGGGNE